MADGNPNRRIGRSVVALVTGFIFVLVITIVTDIILHVTGFFPPLGQPVPDGPLLAATAYRTIYAVLGSYITARLAPFRPMLHAMIGGFIGLGLATVGAAVTWNGGPQYGAHWYPVALIVTALPTAWAGGWLRESQLAKTS